MAFPFKNRFLFITSWQMLRRIIINYVSKCYPIIKIFRTIVIVGILSSYSLFRLHYNNCTQRKFYPQFLGWGQGWLCGGGTRTKCRKTVAEKFYWRCQNDAQGNDWCMYHCIYILENQVSNMWNMRMIYRSKWHLGKVRPDVLFFTNNETVGRQVVYQWSSRKTWIMQQK